MAVLAGKDGSIKEGVNTIAYIDSWTIDSNVDLHGVSGLGDDTKSYVAGQRDTTAQIQGTFDSTDAGQTAITDEIAGGVASHTVELLYNTTGDDGFTGTAFINAQSVGSPKDGKQSFSGTATFSGGISAVV